MGRKERPFSEMKQMSVGTGQSHGHACFPHPQICYLSGDVKQSVECINLEFKVLTGDRYLGVLSIEIILKIEHSHA